MNESQKLDSGRSGGSMGESVSLRTLQGDSGLASRLRSRIRGEVRFDALSRTLYSTDASIYSITPVGVVFPRDVTDVVATLDECRKAGVSVVARGAGTGLTGGAVGPGLQLDFSRFMHRIGPVDVAARTVEAEPGVVLDELNAVLAPHGLHFAPDVATGSRATIGGMIANNSCGAHSVLYGRTVDHVVELTTVLNDGEVVTWGNAASQPNIKPTLGRGRQIRQELGRIRDRNYKEIERRFPKVLRSNGGYGLDRLGPPGVEADVIKVLCGSEGTLGIVVAAKLKLVPLPCCRGVVVLHFRGLCEALRTTPAILNHHPAAIELIDRLIVDAARRNPALGSRCDFLQGDPEALLAVEFFAADEITIAERVNALVQDKEAVQAAFAVVTLFDAPGQKAVWDLRKAGLGLLMSKPGDSQPYAFVEDTAVDPARLGDYIGRFRQVLQREGVEAGYYAHASVGCIHVKPVLNLKDGADVERMRRIAEAVADLALEFGGAMTGEHGDGIVRSCWLERMYGPRIISAFQEVKRLFDPLGLLNPHKIVDPLPMTEHLRYGAAFQAKQVKTHLDFEVYGGMSGLAGMCTGVGECRKRLTGTMCPSYIATGDEKHTTRARANALRAVLSKQSLLAGLDDPQLEEVMDLCLSCKACKSECPTGVDMAKLKAEWLSHRHLTHGVDRRSRFIADMPARLSRFSRFPKVSNVLMQSRLVRGLLEQRYGLDRRMPPPPLALTTFRSWYRNHRKQRPQPQTHRGTVVYFVDTWTNYHRPQVGQAAVKLLERAGFRVVCPETGCCGRPAISKGLLGEAKESAEQVVRILDRVSDDAMAIVGTEPSCILTFVDEYPQLLRTEASRRVASRTLMLESFLRRQLDRNEAVLSFQAPQAPLLYHAHCHQKALVGSADAVALIRRAWGQKASEINSGCCGMAGSFGHEVEHFDVARAIGEDRLFPAIRERGEANIAVSGFSCQAQIEHHTGVVARHVLEYLAEALDERASLDR